MWLTNDNQKNLRGGACRAALKHYQGFWNRGGVDSSTCVHANSRKIRQNHWVPKSLTLVQGRCLMDPTFSHFGEKIIHFTCSKTIEIHFLKQKHKFRVEVRKWVCEGHPNAWSHFLQKKWISLLEDAFRNDRVLSFQQSGCANKRKKWARRQRTAQNRFLARVSQYLMCEKTTIFSVPCTCIRPAR